MNSTLTVTVLVGKCTYHIEMEAKASFDEIKTEVINRLGIKTQNFKILKYAKTNLIPN